MIAKTIYLTSFLLLLIVIHPAFSQLNNNDMPPKSIQSKTIVFIHGAFVSNSCWDQWKTYYESKGYTVTVPPWPYKDAPASVLRSRQPDSAVASLGLTQLVDYYAGIIKKMPEKPILIGHSLGGLLVQLLLQQDLGAAGIAIHSVPPQGVVSFKLSFIRSVWKPLGFFTSVKKSHLMSFKEWQYAFTNGMALEEQQTAYNQLVVPESKKVLREGLTKIARIDFKKQHAPLLFISGSEDHIMPASLNYSNYKKYRKDNSITDYKEFKGRNHYVLGLPTWQEEADYILDWTQNSNLSSTK